MLGGDPEFRPCCGPAAILGKLYLSDALGRAASHGGLERPVSVA